MTGLWSSDWATGDIVTAAEFRKSLGCVADSTLGVAAASFDFTGLPTTYAHMLIVCQLRGDTAATTVGCGIRFNNDTAANYDWQLVQGQAATASALETFGATSISANTVPAASAPASLFGGVQINVQNYGGTTANKTATVESVNKIGTATTNMIRSSVAGFWRSSAAINRITIFPATGNWLAGSRCSIYVMGS